MPKHDDVWRHWVNFGTNSGKYQHVQCRYCKNVQLKHNVKCKHHLRKCHNAPVWAKDSVSGSVPTRVGAVTDDLVDLPETQQSGMAAQSAEEGERPQSQTSNSSMDDYVVRIRNDTKQEVEDLLAKAIFSGNIAFEWIENPYLVKTFEKLGVTFNLPNRKQLSTTILERVFTECDNFTASKLENADYVSIVIDGWQNIRGLGVINIIICTPEPIFYKSFETADEHVTGIYIQEELGDVIKDFGEKRILAVVTDCGKNMIYAQKRIAETLPHIAQINCATHVMNLLINDLIKLPTLFAVISSVKCIVKEICMSKVKLGKFIKAKNAFNNELREKNLTTLCANLYIPSDTRWYGVQLMLRKVLRAKSVLERLAIDTESELTEENRRKTKNDLFWVNLSKVKAFLQPLVDAIAELESDSATISDTLEQFMKLSLFFNEQNLENSGLPETERNQAVANYKHRCSSKFLTKFHYLANYLDPRYNGNCFSSNEIEVLKVKNTLLEYAENLNIVTDEVSKEALADALSEFRNNEGLFSSPLLSKRKALSFWKFVKGFENSKGLATIAIRLLSIPASSASVERSFSLQGRLHSKDRNRIGEKKIEMLMKIQSVLRTQTRKEVVEKPTDLTECAEEIFDLNELDVISNF